jgi:prepilin-type N-terminal cleavage/methylation domain-containing protein
MRRYRGFTLVELTVVIALLGIVGLLMMRLMFFSSRQYTRIDQEITANEEARLLSDYVVSEVHRHDVSQGVSFTVSGSSVFLQIHDSETPFMVEGEAYAYQWMRVTSHDVDGVPRETIEIGF